MAEVYADSSVLVKRHIPEAGTSWFRGIAAPASGTVILTARLSVVEVYSALNRRVREGTLDPTAYATLAADFDGVCVAEYRLIELAPNVAVRACRLLEQHPLRAYDAVQLATALSANDLLLASGLQALTFLSADARLLHAAHAEGLAVDNPNAYP
jgi:predicted nucleic acid-binding protein